MIICWRILPVGGAEGDGGPHSLHAGGAAFFPSGDWGSGGLEPYCEADWNVHLHRTHASAGQSYITEPFPKGKKSEWILRALWV